MTYVRLLSKAAALPLAMMLLLTSCDSAGPDAESPAVLPPSAFSMQTDLFQEDTASKSGGAHFVNAAFRVWPVSLIIGANLIIPAAVTHAAVQAGDPTLDDATWYWTSNTEAANNEYRFTLSARTEDDHINWTMHVAHLDPESGEVIDEFDLYTAQTDPNSKTGSWSLFYKQDGAVRNVLDAEFSVTSETEKEITFSVPEGNDAAGTAVTYTHDGDIRSFYWVQADEDQTHLVTWNAVTHEGSITSSNYNGGEKACWNSLLQDTPCASE